MKIFKLAIALTLCVFSVSCGYHMGSMMHPQVKTIGFSELVNDTKEPLLTAVARNQIAAAFQFDNSLTLKEQDKADCVLYCRITKVTTKTIRYDSQDDDKTYRPNEFEITVTAEFTVLIPGRSEPLIAKRTVSGSALYQYNADPAVGKYNGMKQACYNMARQMVEYTTEAW